MSAPSESAASPSPCACTNISLMQLFHELKQKFPGVPDHVVSNTIELYCHDKQACETHLHREVKASLTHAYHASSSAAARRLNEVKVNPPGKCRNQPIVKHEVAKSTIIKSVTCQGPQTAVLSSSIITSNDSDKKVNIDANQNVVEHTEYIKPDTDNTTTPVTVINIDNCCVKYNAETPSDIELTNDNISASTQEKDSQQVVESTNYKILKSNKIKSNLNSLERLESLNRLEKGKEKKIIKKEESKPIPQEQLVQIPQEKPVEIPQGKPVQIPREKPVLIPQEKLIQNQQEKPLQSPQEKPAQIPREKPTQISQDTPLQIPQRAKRPDTLNFIKPNPDIAFKQTLKEPEGEPNRTVSPVPPKNEPQNQPRDSNSSSQFRADRGYPLNLLVNVNCHMDLSRYDNPWLEDYNSPRAITSVNLTVCTPTSNMASPVRDTGDEDRGFEGHVTVTVSPSTARAPHRRAPPPPPAQPSRLSSPRPSRVAPGPPGSAPDRSLIERQKERRDRLAKALEEEKRRLAQLTRETEILAAPPPAPSAAQSLKEYVERLRSQCDMLSKRLEMRSNEPEEPDSNFYSNIYTGQRPSSYWQCHMCTFRNFPLLNRCEECDMPRIYVGTSLPNTQDSGLGSYRTMSNHDNDDSFMLVENNRALPQLNS